MVVYIQLRKEYNMHSHAQQRIARKAYARFVARVATAIIVVTTIAYVYYCH